jgi:cellulose synthase/poly-beta-1,6-N-acetylglucosamine synthase-like glycosyltransferase
MNPGAIKISITLCAHNPRPEYLRRTLEALRAQTLPQENWELLLIDNASTPALKDAYDLSWHPNGRHLREDKVGKTNAFLLGVRESRGEIILIVDDDNLLAPNYLEMTLRIAQSHPNLGSWGGNVRLCFEEAPPEWTRRHWPLLAGRTVTEDSAVCNLELTEPLPVGAGCCVRRRVAEHYATLQSDPWRAAMGRVGRGLVSGEDTDLAMTACTRSITFPNVYCSL